jgi:hypothetical protein
VIRGLLAEGILLHCFSKRCGVHFGVPGERADGKRIAVPYEAADAPSLRSEFAQPDVALVFTCLAYYSRGLNREQFNEAMKFAIHSLTDVAREGEYRKWKSVMSKEDIDRLPCQTGKALGLEYGEQQETLFGMLRFNVQFIEFWLTRLVIPRDLAQYSKALTASANDLAEPSDARFTMGFSGTKDSRFVLPLALKQQPNDAKVIRSTDVNMMIRLVQSIVANSQPVLLQPTRDVPRWQTLLLTAIKQDCSAVIDVGALLVGGNLREFASWLARSDDFSDYCDRQTPPLRGVLFNHHGRWRVISRELVEFNRGESISDADAFVIFDEAQCRGSDMRLRRNTTAMLVLGPQLPKSRLMQAAGRLRSLGPDAQRVKVCATGDVLESAGLLGSDNKTDWKQRMLVWTIANGIRETQRLLPQWLDLASIYSRIKATPPCDPPPTDPQHSKPKDLYGSSYQQRSLRDALMVRVECCKLGSDVRLHIEKYSGGAVAVARVYDGEVEREAHIEQEEDRELKKEIKRLQPLPAIDTRVMFQELAAAPLAATSLAPLAVPHFAENAASLYVTPNFHHIVQNDSPESPTLRRVQFVWEPSPGTGIRVALAHREIDYVHDIGVGRVLHWRKSSLSPTGKAAIAIYNGQPLFDNEEQEAAAKPLVLAAYKAAGEEGLRYVMRCRGTESQWFDGSAIQLMMRMAGDLRTSKQ